MRGLRTLGVTFTIALGGSDGLAQSAPAAKLGRVQEVTPAGGSGERSQAPQPMPPPAGTLPPPRPLPGPTVTESRGANGSSGPAATFGTPVPIGQPVAVGPPVAVAPPVVVTPPSVFPTDAGPVPSPAPPILAGAAGPFGTLTGPQKFQVEADFLMWFLKSSRYPALLTTSLPAFSGIPGAPTTRVLFADEPFESTLHAGGRFGGVYWFGTQQRWGLDGNVWFLAQRGKEFTANSFVDPVIARPFFNVNAGLPFSQLAAAPGLATGAVAITVETYMNGAEANVRRYVTSSPGFRLDVLGGFRYMGLNEELNITETFARTSPSDRRFGVPTAEFGTVTDRFRTENSFYGAQVGGVGELRRGRWFVEGRATIAFGAAVQSIQASGSQVVAFSSDGVNPGGVGVFPGGLLALPGANIGTFTRDRFAVLPEVGLKVGYHVTPNVRLAVGYNFLYLSHVVRPGDQIDPGLDVTRIPNFPVPAQPLQATRPTVPFNDTGVFAQGITFSLQWSY